MGSLADWFDPHSAGGILAVVFGFVIVLQILGFFTALATTAPIVAGVAIFAVALLGVCAWAAARNGAFETDGTDDEGLSHGSDPLVVLKRRYARGELSEAEFERRLGTLLEINDHVRIDSEAELERA